LNELRELKAAKQLFNRRQSRLTPQHAAIIRVIRVIDNNQNNKSRGYRTPYGRFADKKYYCIAINRLGKHTEIYKINIGME
jgi:hypothetical protein